MEVNAKIPDQQERVAESETVDRAGRDDPYLDVVFGVLQNPRRRQVLRFLDETPVTDIGELAVHIAALENDIDPRTVQSDQRKRVYVSLYQSHLPTIHEAGVIEYDRQRGTVEATPAIETYLGFLTAFEDSSPRSPRTRAAYALWGAGVTAFTLGIGVFLADYSLFGALGLSTGGIASLAIGQYLRNQR